MNQEDRELLGLAAKAAGIELEWNDRDVPGYWSKWRGLPQWEEWNPLTDEGDALRLAAMLEIDVLYRIVGGDRVECIAPGQERVVEYHNSEPYVATRRAIVRAAAAIGKSMMETNHG